MTKVPRGLKWSLGVALVAGAVVGAWWFTQPEPLPPPVEDVADAEEADPSREETEDLMRKIGYVQ